MQYLKELEDGFIHKWAKERSPTVKFPDGREEINVNQKNFNHVPDYELSELTISCQWGKIGKPFKKFKDNYEVLYYCTEGVDENNKDVRYQLSLGSKQHRLIECLANNHRSSCMLAHGYRKGDERLSLPQIGAK